MKGRSGLYTLLAMGLGIGAALFQLPFAKPLALFVSENFIRILKLISLPLIFLSISSTLLNLESISEAKRLFKRIITYTLLTTLLAASIALILFIIINPAKGVALAEGISTSFNSAQFTFAYLLEIIPDNPIAPFLNNQVLSVLFMAVVLSIAIQKAPQKGCMTLAKLFKELFQALLNIARFVIKLLPFAIFGFTYLFVEEMSTQKEGLSSLILYSSCVILANLIQGFVILPLIMRAKGLRAYPLFRRMMPALTTAFFSKSSSASLPMALECSKQAGISEKTASFSFPICTVINMNGCAAFILITTLYVTMRSGIALTIPQMLPWILLSTLAAVGNAGVPMGCFFLTSAFLVGMNVPLEIMGLILPLYTLFDMVETALNVWSDSCVTAIADRSKEEISKEMSESFSR